MAPGHLGPGGSLLSVTRAVCSPHHRPLHQKLGGQDVHGRLTAPCASRALCVCVPAIG